MPKPGRDEGDLLGFVRRFADRSTFTVEEELGHGYVRLRVTEAERRQALQDIRCVEDVVKELVRNARDAGAREIYVSFQKERGRWRNVTVLDDGVGIPEPLHRKIFEARVTSKVDGVVEDAFGVHGRGMALFSIKQVAEEVRLIDSVEGRGTIIYTRLDTHKIPEKKDQSTFPRLERDEEGTVSVGGGPRNVPRVLAEYALGCKDVRIFLGSNAEILATLYHRSQELRKNWAAGTGDGAKPLWFDLGGAREGRALHLLAWERLGLNVSERNAFRILEYEIPPLLSVNEVLSEEGRDGPPRRSDLHRQARTVWVDHLARRLDQEDMEMISSSLGDLLRCIGERHLLLVDPPVIRRRKNSIIISLALHDKEESD